MSSNNPLKKNTMWDHNTISAALSPLSIPYFSSKNASFSIDTRTLEPGNIFVALKGEAKSGVEFLKEAFHKGAVAAIVPSCAVSPGSFPLIKVNDPLQALELLGQYARDHSPALRVAITGSNGKTTTKKWLSDILAFYGETTYAQQSYNNHIGVPLSLTQLNPQTKFGVFEIGMNHKGEITPLSLLVRPHIGIITTVEQGHIGNMGSLEAIAEEKACIFDGVESKGSAILNEEATFFPFLFKKAKERLLSIVTIGSSKNTDLRLVDFIKDKGCLNITACFKGDKNFNFTLHTQTEHFIFSALFILLTLRCLGLDFEKALPLLSRLKPLEGRGREYLLRSEKGYNYTLIDDAYNANPDSVRRSLKSLQERKGYNRKIVILGEMRELGEFSKGSHENLYEYLLQSGIKGVFAVGNLLKPLYEQLPTHMRLGFSESAADLYSAVSTYIQEGDILLIKGSNGSKIHLITNYLIKNHC